jgi:iron transport multicopper oxidase
LNWNITYVTASPDGYARRFIGINGQWPNPAITGTIGDILKINVVNGLGDQYTSIHFHGISQQNTTFEDGPVGVTQCPIAPGQSFVYQFRFLQTGTYWYHAHIGGQYIDGFRGALIIKDNCAPYKADSEFTLTLSDLYHQEAPSLVNYYLSPDNTDATGGVEPVPDAALINEAQNVQFPITAGKTYMVHIINMGAISGMYLQFDQHNVTVIEADGVWVNPWDTNQLYVAVAQRYTILLTAKTSSSQNYAIVATMNPNMFGEINAPANPSVTGYLVYNSAAPMPAPFTIQPQVWDDSTLAPFDAEALYDGSITSIYLTVSFGEDGYGSTRAMFNGQTYVSQKVPTMFTALSAPADVIMNPTIYGRGTNPFVLPFNAVVEVNINNHDDRAHPFHLHGHTFQIVDRAYGSDLFPGLAAVNASNPMRRDTLVVYGESTATIRFTADNPGIWLFHCHTEWHVESGLTATFIEAPDVLVARAPYIPNSHKTVCDVLGIPRKGNAVGNTKTGQWLNTTGERLDAGDPSGYYGAMVNPPTN